MSHAVGKLLDRPMKIRMFTDSRTLLDSIASLFTSAEKHLIIEILCLRKANRSGESANSGSMSTQHNVADALTKDVKNSALNDVLRSNTIKTPKQQWLKGIRNFESLETILFDFIRWTILILFEQVEGIPRSKDYLTMGNFTLACMVQIT